ncbi:MAG: flagellar type III secretion system pore protein FliP [Pirellulaceae bacterium]|nr:flagellar type III secretion system pore protein FliP [Planctomycetales bacterium]
METQSPDFVGAAEQIIHSGAVEGMAPPLQVALFLAGFALLTTLLVSMTAFTRIVIVLSFVRRALTTQEIPPNPVIMGLAMFLTLFVMRPTIDAIMTDAVNPYLRETDPLSMPEAWAAGSKVVRNFMITQTRTQELSLFILLSGIETPYDENDIPLRVLVPAFMVSELKTAFIMGFCIYVPFLLIDLVVSTVLMSLGMMMMPPAMMSLPFKILLFVLVDGWQLIASALSVSFG